ncbi:MAG: alternative ribosome rescue aminoacyl-tRNA hydrolase ArfB [Desulfopila sp.]
MIEITSTIFIAISEITFTPIRAQGAGGQNVNKVASAIHLRFDIQASSLPTEIKNRLLQLRDKRRTDDGSIVIKAQRFRHQEQNRDDAIQRLVALIRSVTSTPRRRKPTRPSRTARARRMDGKTRRGKLKALRKKVR